MTPKRLDPVKPNLRIGLSALLVSAFALKLLVLLQLRGHPLIQPDAGLDTTAYAGLAGQVLAGNWALGPGLYYVSPLYIYFLAVWLAVLKSYTAVRVVQIALGTASVGFIFQMAREWFGDRAAWIAGSLAALTGLFTFYEILILQSSIDVFLTSSALLALAKRRPLVAGVIFGIQTLNRPNVLIAAVGIAIVALALRRVRPAVALAAGLAIGMSPVAIRNVVVSHEWTFVSSHGGLNFYIGNHETATGFYQVVPGVSPTIGGQQKDVMRVAAKGLGRPVTDAEASEYFFGLARAWIAGHPGAALVLFAKKFTYVFNAAHLPLPQSYPFYAYDERTALRFYVVGTWLLAPLGLAGLIFAMPSTRRDDYAIWASFVPAYAASVAIFFVAERYSLPVLVPLCAGAGAAVDLLVRRPPRRTAALIVTAAVLAIVVNWPLHTDDGRWIEGLRLAQQYVVHQRYDEADAWARRLDEHNPPHPGGGSYGVGAQLLAVNMPNRALPYLEAAHGSDPGNAKTEFALGQALLKVGRTADAIPHLRTGFEAGIELPDGGYDYADALRNAGDLAGAAAAVTRITPPDNGDVEPWLRLGRLAMEVHAPDKAERFFRQGVQMRPDLASAHQQYGLNLLILKRFDEAAGELSDAVRLDPHDPDSLAHLAYCEFQLGRRADAQLHAQAALAVDPSNQLASQLLALMRTSADPR